MKPLVFGVTSTSSLTGSVLSLGVLLNALAVVQRPTRIVHVGIGDGKGESSVWIDWSLTKALAIDAEPINIEVLNANSQFKALIDVQTQVIAETEGSVAYFVASNPSENGLIDPSLLKMVWPSLTLSHQTERDATTLDRAALDMLDVSKDANAEPLWLIVDALPGVSILSGGTKLLEASSLVFVRALAEAGFRGEPAGADVAAIDRLLEDKGFSRVIYLPGLNPKIGHAIYARKKILDVISPAETEALNQLAEANKTAEELTVSLKQSSENLQALQAKLDATSQERDAAQANAAGLSLKLQEQTKAKETALNQLSEAKKSAEALTVSLKQSSENLQALQAKLDATSQERDAAQANAAGLSSKLQEQTKAKETALNQLSEANKNAEALTAKLKAKETALETELGQVQRLSLENQELIHRQQLMNEELVKAEGQISLIKDLLLREQGI